MRRRLCCVLFLGLVGFFLSGCARPRPIRFIGILSKGNARIAAASKELMKSIDPLRSGQEVSSSKVESAYRSLGGAIQEVAQEVRGLRPPVGSTQADELLTAYRSFLSTEQDVYDKQVTQIYRTAVSPGSPLDKWAAISQLLVQMDQEESKAYNAVNEAQNAFAKRHGLRLE